MQDQYNDTYYQERYIQPLLCKIGLNKIYYLWTAFFCLIKAAHLKKNAKVLDFGCGIGNYVWALRKLGMDAYGIDSALSAEKHCRNPGFCRYSTEKKLPFVDKSFDLVCSYEVLEHLPPSELEFYLREMQRVSKGRMIHMVGVKEKGSIVTEDKTHLIIEDETWWKNTFSELGYKVKVGNLFYFFPCTIKGSKKGYFLLSVK
jgi:cyclopropane fatty-acyl-phospholipid synthase-like methyltransferase